MIPHAHSSDDSKANFGANLKSKAIWQIVVGLQMHYNIPVVCLLTNFRPEMLAVDYSSWALNAAEQGQRVVEMSQ